MNRLDFRMTGTVKAQPRRDAEPSRHDLHLAELPDFRPDQHTNGS